MMEKTVDCVLLGYAFHSIGYRFLIIKSEVSDMHVRYLRFYNQESVANAMKSISQENTIHSIWSQLPLLWNWHIDFRQTTPGS